MQEIGFFFWEAMKAVSLALLGLLAAKAVSGLRAGEMPGARRFAALRGVLYAAVLALVVVGARTVGNNVAAELDFLACDSFLSHGQVSKALDNAQRAVALRPASLRYWRMLERTKIDARQFASALDDEPALRSLNHGDLGEEDAVRLALCHYLLAQYDKVIPLTQALVRYNRFFATPYVLQGMSYLGEKKYDEAEKSFLAVLELFPSTSDAVEGLAHAYYLSGQAPRALQVLNATSKYAFSSESRKRFEDLKALYAP